MFPPVLMLTVAAATSLAPEPTQGSWLPTAVIAAVVAAGASFVAALIAAAASLFNTYKNYQLQILLKSMDEDNKRRTALEDRAHALRSEHISPFFTELRRNVNLARDVRLHVQDVQTCPLSSSFKRRLLRNSNVVPEWGDSGVALGDHTAKLLLAMDTDSAKKFSTELDRLIRSQIDIVKKLEESFVFSDDAVKAIDESFAEHKRRAASLWSAARTAIVQSKHIDDGQAKWLIDDLGNAISGVASRLKFKFQTSANTWSVWWRFSKSAAAEATYEAICRDRDRFIAAVAGLPGVLDTQTENETNEQELHSLMTVRFVSEPNLRNFCEELLPLLKIQTKELWTVGPQELIT